MNKQFEMYIFVFDFKERANITHTFHFYSWTHIGMENWFKFGKLFTNYYININLVLHQ